MTRAGRARRGLVLAAWLAAWLAPGLAAWLATGAPADASDAALDALMSGLAARRHGQVDFVEQHFLALLKRPVESYGVLTYDAPRHLEKRTLEPRPETLIVDGDRLSVERKGHTHVLDLSAYPAIGPFIEGLRATLAGDLAALERGFEVTFDGSLEHWSLTLVPHAAEAAETIATVRIEGANDALRRVEILEANGDRSLMTLRARPAP